MKKNFIVNFLLLFFVNLLVKPAWLFTDLLVQRETGEDYGAYFVLFNLSMMLNMLLDFGISNFNNRKVAGNEQKFKNYFSNVVTLRFLLALLYFVALGIVGLVLGYDSFQMKCLSLLGMNQILLAGITYLRSNLTALGFFKWDSLVSITDRVVMSGIMLFALFSMTGIVSISLFIEVQFIGYLVSFLLALTLLMVKGGVVVPSWNYKFSKTLLQKSYPYALIVILMSAYSYSDSLMLSEMLDHGIWENMIYAQSFRILMAGNNYCYLIAVLLLPMLSKMIKEKKEVTSLIRLSGTLLLFAVSLFAVIAHVYSLEIINLLYGQYVGEVSLRSRFNDPLSFVINAEEIQYSAKVFSYLILGIVPMSFNYIYGVLLTAGGKMKVLNWIAVTGLGGNIILNLILIPQFGALGAAVASISTQGICALGQWYSAYQEHSIKFPVVHFLKFLAIIIAIFMMAQVSKSYFSNLNGILLTVVLCSTFVLWLKVVSWKNIQQLLLKRK